MFKEEYKKHFDEIKPSSRLIEQTKKRMMEEYEKEVSLKLQPKEDKSFFETEEQEAPTENVIAKGRIKKQWIVLAGTLAAGIAIVTTGVYLKQHLKLVSQNTSGQIMLCDTEVPEEQEETTTGTALDIEQKSKTEQQKTEKASKNKIRKQNKSELESIAGRTRGSGIVLDYASMQKVIFHGDFGIIVYNLADRAISTYIPQEEITGDIKVNSDGTKIYLFESVNGENEVKEYNIVTGEMTVWMEFIDAETYFANVSSVYGSGADLYISSASTGQKVTIGEGYYMQLMYQAPSLDKLASLSVSIINIKEKTEQLVCVFGSLGEQICEKMGQPFGGYHNEAGKQLFEIPKTTEKPSQEDANKENKEEGMETQTPKETEKPRITEEPKETEVAPTEAPQEES